MLTAIILSLIAMFLFGIANGLQKIPSSRIGAVAFITMKGLVISVVTFTLAVFTFDLSKLDLSALILGITLAAISYFGVYFFSIGIIKSKVGVVIPITSSRIILMSIIGFLFLGETTSFGKLLWIIPIIIGILFVSADLKALREPGMKKGIIYALIATVIWGITMPFFGVFSNKLGVYVYSFVLEFTVCIMSVLQALVGGGIKAVMPPKAELKKSWLIIVVIGVAGAFASIAINAAYATGFVSISAAVLGISPLVSVLIGRIFLHEKMSTQQYIGTLVIIIGLIGISAF